MQVCCVPLTGSCLRCTQCHVFFWLLAEFFVHSDKRHKNKASFGSLCEAYLSAFALMLALWMDPACSPGDKNMLEKYMSKVAARSTPLSGFFSSDWVETGCAKARQNRARQRVSRSVQSTNSAGELAVAQCLRNKGMTRTGNERSIASK
jgi:hypothetical protein